MGYQGRRDSLLSISSYNHASCVSASRPISVAVPAVHEPEPDPDLSLPFSKLDGLDRDDIRETAYEVFFTSCRSSPGFGGRHAIAFYSSQNENSGDVPGSPGSLGRGNGVGMVATSRIKRALGLKPQLKRLPSRRTSSVGGYGMGSSPSSPSSPHGHGGGSPGMSFTVPSRTMARRPLTSAEIMRLQMRVTEESDTRLRKTLMRTLVGQMGRRAETIILPLELLRHLKPSEFNDGREYQFWQRRQLRVLEAGLILYPSIPLDQSNAFALKLSDIVRSGDSRHIDTGKNSDTMKTLCNSVVSLSWRNANGNPTDICHWADGYPLNIHLYVALLQSIFDLKEGTMVLDEVDELIELMKKTWTTLGINRPMHNMCLTWVLFYQYVLTGQTEPDLLCASFAMLTEAAIDAKKPDRDPIYVKALASVLSSIIGWGEKRLLDYHGGFSEGNTTSMENFLPLVLQAKKILDEDVAAAVAARQEQGDKREAGPSGTSVDQVDFYIRSSVRNAFAKIMENGNIGFLAVEAEPRASEILIELAQVTEELAAKEKENFSTILKKWHPVAAGVAALTLHNCYGTVTRLYLSRVTMLTNETINVLQRAGKLEKILVQMVVEDTADCEDGGKTVVREMVPYEVDSVILRLLRKWIDEKLRKSRDCIQRAKQTETWNPKSKTEPFAQSAVELMKLAKETVDEFFQLPIGISDDLVQDFAEGLERIVREYTTFVASCGTKQSYVPSLPPLTRCNRDSRFVKLWKRTSCSVSVEELHRNLSIEGHHPRPSTSRGTQRLYIRLNTLHYLLSHLNSLDKTLSLSPRIVPSNQKRFPRSIGASTTYFELARASMQGAIQHVAEVAAYRLIFLDSNSVFYESLYVFGVAKSRIRPALRIVKQNLSLLGGILIDRAQPLAIKEIMKAAFSVFLMVLLAGGSTRIFTRADHEMIEEDFDSLKRVFCSSGVGVIAEYDVDKDAEIVEGVVQLMGLSTDQLVEDFSTAACERSGMGVAAGSGKRLPMPPTTGRWNSSDPNTILRVLCHRNDHAANQFLKKTFQLPKRR